MGCDIHFVVEKKIGEKWIGLVSTDEIGFRPEAKSRNYDLFAEIANVRGKASVDRMYPRFLPEGISELSIYAITSYGSDGHSHSWLSLKEFCAAAARVKANYPDWKVRAECAAYDLFGISLDEAGDEKGYRIVFWFDN